MSHTLRDVMTRDPVCLPVSASAADAARQMALHEIGDVVVVDDDSSALVGLVTDRDLVVRVIAMDHDAKAAPLGDVCTREVVSLSPQDSVEDAVTLMRTHAIRRMPVVQDGKPVGLVTLGDLSLDRDPTSVLADISRAPSNS